MMRMIYRIMKMITNQSNRLIGELFFVVVIVVLTSRGAKSSMVVYALFMFIVKFSRIRYILCNVSFGYISRGIISHQLIL